MEPKDLVIASVLQKLPLPEAKFPVGGQFWLTVYLEGRPNAYANARPILATLGWLNLDLEVDFSGFVYAKKRVQNGPNQISEAVDEILQVCTNTDLDFSLIDADTSFEPKGSTFHNLFKPLTISRQ